MVPSRILDEEISVSCDAAVDTDRVLRALSDPRRRFVLGELQDAGESLDLGELATRIVAWECGCEDADHSTHVEQSVLVSLYHVHAPKLDDAGLVDFDPDARSVVLTDVGRDIQPAEV